MVKPDGTPYEVIVLFPGVFDMWLSSAARYLKSCIWRAGGEVTLYDAHWNDTRQLATFEDALLKKPDAFLIWPLNPLAFEDYIPRAEESGIPCFNFDVAIDSPLITGFTGHDQELLGYSPGQYVVARYKDDPGPVKILEIWGNPIHLGSKCRYDGFKRALGDDPKFIVYESVACDFKPALALSAVMDGFTANPDLDVIFSQSNAMADGIVSALKETGHAYKIDEPGHITYVGVDATIPGVNYTREGYMDGSSLSSPIWNMDTSLKQIITFVCLGQPIDKKIILPAAFINRDRLDYSLINPDIFPENDWNHWPILDDPDIIPTPQR